MAHRLDYINLIKSIKSPTHIKNALWARSITENEAYIDDEGCPNRFENVERDDKDMAINICGCNQSFACSMSSFAIDLYKCIHVSLLFGAY